MKLIHQFFAVLNFLTILPAKKERYSLSDIADGLWAFPFAGLAAGIILSLAGIIIYSFVPVFLGAAILLIFWAGITGGLHLDGLIDCCDALFASKPAKERLSILKDVSAGSFGVIGAVLFLLLKYGCIISLQPKIVILILPLAMITGRSFILYAVFRFPYAREQGTGKIFKEKIKVRDIIISLAVIACVSLSLSFFKIPFYFGLIAMGACLLFTEIFGMWVLRKIPGFTGDVYGAVCELSEALVLVVAVLFFKGSVSPGW